MPTLLERLAENRLELANNADALMEKAAKAGADLSEDDMAKLREYRASSAKLDEQIAEVEATNAQAKKLADLQDRLRESQKAEEANQETRKLYTKPGAESWGVKVTESPEFRSYQGVGTSAKIAVPGFLETRAALTTADLYIEPYRWAGPPDPAFLTPFLGAIGRVRTNSGTVEYLTWSDTPLAGGPIAEGDLKPEASISPTPVPLSLSTYAHWKAITRQALEDLAQIQSIIENKLRQGLIAKLEQVASTALTGSTTVPSTGDATADLSAVIRQAMGEVQARGYNPRTVLLNPVDFSALDVATASPLTPVTAPTAYWGLQPVAAAGIPAGTAYVGDFSVGMTWFDRGDESVYVSDSHADYFIRNLLVILAEVRAAFAVTEPGALQKAVGVPGGAPPVGGAISAPTTTRTATPSSTTSAASAGGSSGTGTAAK